jgi:hypothetical protein
MLFEPSVDEADALSEIAKLTEVSCTDASLGRPGLRWMVQLQRPAIGRYFWSVEGRSQTIPHLPGDVTLHVAVQVTYRNSG